ATRYFPSFPTRRSSDLAVDAAQRVVVELLRGQVHRDPTLPDLEAIAPEHRHDRRVRQLSADHRAQHLQAATPPEVGRVDRRIGRSEEHTSELQSPYDLV